MAGIGSIISFVIYGMIAIVILVGLFCRYIRDYCKKPKTVEATLVHKESFEKQAMFKSMAPKNVRCYVMTFMAGQKLSFYVPEEFYGQYQPEEKGILTYQGSRLLAFQTGDGAEETEIQKNA